MSSSNEPVVVDEEGVEVHSPGSDEPDAPAPKKRKKKEPRDNSKRGCKMTVEKRMACIERSFSLAGRLCIYFYRGVTHFLAGIIDAKNCNRLKEENRNAAVVAYCNGDIEERFSKV